MSRFDNILDTIGNTPVVRIGKLAPAGVNLFVKAEAFNPMGSVKDRLAFVARHGSSTEVRLNHTRRVSNRFVGRALRSVFGRRTLAELGLGGTHD